MAREKIITTEETPEQKVKHWVAGLESASQVLGWLQVQDQAAVEAAFVQAVVQRDKADLPALKLVAEIVATWKAKGEKPVVSAPAPTAEVERMENEGGKAAAEKPAPTQPAAPTPAEKNAWIPVDYAARADEFSARIIAEAEREESHVPAKILKLRDQVARLTHAMLKLKQAEKQCKDKIDLAVEELDGVESEHKAKEAARNRPLPLIDNAKANAGGSTAAVAAPASSDAWRLAKLDTLSLSAGLLKKLAEHEPRIETVGDLADWQAKKGEFWMKDLKGVGGAAAGKLADAFDKFWREHPEYTQNAASAKPADKEADRNAKLNKAYYQDTTTTPAAETPIELIPEAEALVTHATGAVLEPCGTCGAEGPCDCE